MCAIWSDLKYKMVHTWFKDIKECVREKECERERENKRITSLILG